MTDELYGFHLEDARNLEEFIRSRSSSADNLVDAIITSPPYADIKDYGGDDQIGQQPYRTFLNDIRNVLTQCYRVSADDAALWTVTDVFKRDTRVVRLPSDLADVAENLYPSGADLGVDKEASLAEVEECPECGSYLRQGREYGEIDCTGCDWSRDALDDSWTMSDYIIWDKQRTLPWADQKLRNVHEHVTVFGKTDDIQYDIDDVRISDPEELTQWWVGYPERYSPDGKIPTNLWEYPIPKQGNWGPKLSVHPSPFPLEMVERMIRMSTDKGDVVLDPFAGVGPTLAVAKALGRKAIGFELNPEYQDAYEDYITDLADEKYGESVESEQDRMERKIWTLRIHKYAVQLYKQLTEDTGIDHAQQMGVTNVFALFDEDTVPPESDNSPDGEITFTLSGSSAVDSDGLLEQAAEGIRSGGSGSYYGLQDIELKSKLAGQVVQDIGSETSSLDSDMSLHTYIKGHHHWCVEELTVREWVRKYGTKVWRQEFIQNGYPPILSNLHIQQKDETRGNPPELSKEGQSSVLDFQQPQLGTQDD
jgi:DNA modification methylase